MARSGAVIIAAVVVIVTLALVTYWPHITDTFSRDPGALWLHLLSVGEKARGVQLWMIRSGNLLAGSIWAVIVAIVAVVVIAAVILLGPQTQTRCIFCAVEHTLATSTPLGGRLHLSHNVT